MKKIKVTICTGTACYVMGNGEMMLLEESLPTKIKNQVELTASPCLGLCNSTQNERSKAPYVIIDEEIISDANLNKVIDIIAKKLEN